MIFNFYQNLFGIICFLSRIRKYKTKKRKMENFIKYIKDTFEMSEQEINLLIENLNKPLKKSIRINTNKISIENFKRHSEQKKWTLTESEMWKNMLYIDREKDLNIALWNTLEHMTWLFYVQEVSASSSPFVMSWDKIDFWDYKILDMSASPWWKTTQLAEYYPNSKIIANEFDKPRIKQLFTNIERMWWVNIAVTNYDWRHFKSFPQEFDKVLLDAPCSWEWTCFKWTNALKYWNIKNIKSIAKLQFWLLESGLITLKVWWEIVYSTCTLNRLENEEVVEKIIKKYWESVEIIPFENWSKYLRFWPHKNKTWWFFACKIKKIKSIEKDTKKDIKPWVLVTKLKSKEEKLVKTFFEKNIISEDKEVFFYKIWTEIFASHKNFYDDIEKIFFFKVWVQIWEIIDWKFKPNFFLWHHFENKFEKVYLDKEALDKYLRWEDIEIKKLENLEIKENTFVEIKERNKDVELNLSAWLAFVKDGYIKNFIPKKIVRK